MHVATVGTTTTLYVHFTDENDDPADPTAVTLQITDPDGNVTTPVPTDDPAVTGRFTYELPLTLAGLWQVVWTGTGVVAAVDYDEVLAVAASPDDHAGLCSDWVSVEDLFACGPCASIDAEARRYDLAADAVASASWLLNAHSHGRYPGICVATDRPCRTSSCWPTPYNWSSWQWGDYFSDCACGAASPDRCGCPTGSEIELQGPVIQVLEVLVDGVEFTEWRLDRNVLRRLDGSSWPSCQDLTLDTTEDRTFSIRYAYGAMPPPAGRTAAKRLACELYQSCIPAGNCSLPKRVSTLTRQGVSVGFVDPFEFFSEGRLGIYEVDAFLTAEHTRATQGPAVLAGPHVPRRAIREGGSF